ncbi:MAG: hypothetical protein IKM07_05355 [Clostridia bacterium]|nr:hypothetical protein [Clostridia bacterium]
MALIKTDFNTTLGPIKPLHGVGQPPLQGIDYSMFAYLKEAGIPYSRLHDVGGMFGGNLYVDIPNIFRDFDADPTDPASYDFVFTDRLITALMENGCEPFFRLGVTIENYSQIKYYRIDPPRDFHKWAVICEHIIRHYTQGWADGFNYKITYWEIWNEPDNHPGDQNNMWRGTPEQYFELYDVSARHLKACFGDAIKVGGYAGCGFYILTGRPSANTGSNARYEYLMQFFVDFMAYVKAHRSPMDFFSWHNYDWIEPMFVYADFVRKSLDEAGYTHTESICNEWYCNGEDLGTMKHASFNTGMVLAMQNMPVDSAMIYDARCGLGIYSPMFDPITKQPRYTWYGYKAFNELYKLGTQVALETDEPRVYAVAATGEAGGCVVIANTAQEDYPLTLDLGREITSCLILDDEHKLEPCEVPSILKANDILCITVK